ncbi:hypothetical protein R1flu_023101 [Riccia fluitans]|uniref:Malectin-like domain-containing protein n=1 Tax=Riccia fluitans TaxID=41844 RepID=A0ABD1XR26_9MARC
MRLRGSKDFLSIDCGARKPYVDVQLGLKWDTDDNYVNTGVIQQMKEGQDFPQQLYSYRYFPLRRNKHCYLLPVKIETTYLLRVRLFPGSVGEKSSVALPVDFNVTFINNLFFSYSALTDKDRKDTIYESVFHSFQREEIALCLLQGSKGTPFINSIELRGLPKSCYIVAENQGDSPQFMVLGDRLNMGAKETDSFFRYPDDDFDRFWWPAVSPRFPSFARVDESSFAQNLSQELSPYVPGNPTEVFNWPPNRTLLDAWVGTEFAFQLPRTRVDTNTMYAAFYFMEIRPKVDITATDVWENIAYAVENTTSDIQIGTRDTWSSTLSDIVLYDKFIHVNVSKESSSTVKSVVFNGFEYYYRFDFDISATYSKDKTAFDGLQETFGLEDLQGDPCFPVAWDWVSCDTEASRIQKLKLSHMNLSGPIPENISSLLELTEM